jgi:hypothetical protein
MGKGNPNPKNKFQKGDKRAGRPAGADLDFVEPASGATHPPEMRKVSIAPCSSIGETPRSVRFYAAADVSSRAEPPGLMLSAIAESVVTTPFTSDWPVPPNVSMPRRASNRPMGRLI